jgi:hypothetical protein
LNAASKAAILPHIGRIEIDRANVKIKKFDENNPIGQGIDKYLLISERYLTMFWSNQSAGENDE